MNGTGVFQRERSDRIREYGMRIFDALFPPELLHLYMESRHYAEGQRLRLFLSTSSPVLAAVRWELAYDGYRGTYLALDPEICLIRIWASPGPPPPITPLEQLRILGVFPSPNDLPPLGVEREVHLLQQAVEIPTERGGIELTLIRENVTLDSSRQALLSEEYHVLHFSGDGAFDRESRSGVLFLEDEEKRSVRVTGEQLGVLLRGTGIRLATLIATESAAFGLRDMPEREVHAVAPSLVEAGVPAVIGVEAEITDRSAITFVRAFYASMADRFPVDQAVIQARQAIYKYVYCRCVGYEH
jgi:hypothetical protein